MHSTGYTHEHESLGKASFASTLETLGHFDPDRHHHHSLESEAKPAFNRKAAIMTRVSEPVTAGFLVSISSVGESFSSLCEVN